MGYTSFNDWDGIQSLSGFDSFYGVDDYSGFSRSQTLDPTQDVVCHSQAVEIIQQRLAVLQEMAKRIITEQICEVETQVITFEQYYQSLSHFHGDLRHYSGYQVGYDSGIVSHFGNIYGSDGSFCTDDWGFTGNDIGLRTIVPTGNNWDNESSHASVDSAYYAARNSYYVNHFLP
ncbi:hypothetical protein DFH07DRAFT_983320 [Mycena maculata]|uniref:Uncharacterized protein n=1 Tax=Mycena maculata TaxID=230809 RepID=A0AAD7N010_9AGAR|nr:hypothetical protein DFH07DRAFT_983320 [Mycena maculata]